MVAIFAIVEGTSLLHQVCFRGYFRRAYNAVVRSESGHNDKANMDIILNYRPPETVLFAEVARWPTSGNHVTSYGQ